MWVKIFRNRGCFEVVGVLAVPSMPWGSELNMNHLLAAIAFAAHKHRDQRRKDLATSLYINHHIALAMLLANEAWVDGDAFS